MVQLQLILKRLRKPSVIASLTSQILTLFILFGVNVDATLITSIVATFTSIFVMLGIFSNPDAQKKGYRDDIMTCTNCNQISQHVKAGDNMVCTNCGATSTNATSANAAGTNTASTDAAI